MVDDETQGQQEQEAAADLLGIFMMRSAFALLLLSISCLIFKITFFGW